MIQPFEKEEKTFKTLESNDSDDLSDQSSLESSEDCIIDEISKIKPSIIEWTKTA